MTRVVQGILAAVLFVTAAAADSAVNLNQQGSVLLNVLTASNSANLQDTTSFTSLYDDYDLIFDNIVCVTNNTTLEIQVHSGGTFQTTGYLNSAGGVTTYIDLLIGNANFSNTSGIGFNSFGLIQNVNSTSVNKFLTLRSAYYNGSIPSSINTSGFWNGGQGAIDGILLRCNGGATNISTGTLKIYGKRKGL